MVPTARLELAQLSPLPPQDSVSTNFTTTAGCTGPACMRNTLSACCLLVRLRFYSEKWLIPFSKSGKLCSAAKLNAA